MLGAMQAAPVQFCQSFAQNPLYAPFFGRNSHFPPVLSRLGKHFDIMTGHQRKEK